MKKVGTFLFYFFFSFSVFAQTNKDSSSVKQISKQATRKQIPDSIARKHSPRKATMYSAICPGLGQIYNRKAWKLPFIYGGLGATSYLFVSKTVKYF